MVRSIFRAVALVVVAAVLLGATWSVRRPANSGIAGTDLMRQGTGHVRLAAPSAAAKPTASPTLTRVPPATRQPAPARPSYMVLIVLDGARPGYFDVANIPHVRTLIQSGTRYDNAFAGILESETPSGHAAMTTGNDPRSNGGILSFGWANADNTPVNLFNADTIRAGALERLMRAANVPTIASQVHRSNPKAKVVALSGYKYYAADAIGGPDADVTMYFAGRANGTFGPTAIPGHVPPAAVLNDPSVIAPSSKTSLTVGNHLAMNLASESFKKMRQQVTLINLPEFDWPLGHPWGASRDQADMKTLMQAFDRDLAMLEDTYRKAGVLDRTMFVLTADHGFAPIYHQVPKSAITSAVTRAGASVLRDTYHTGSYLWLRDKTKAAAVAANISAEQNPYIQSVYFRSPTSTGATYLRATGADLFRAPGVEAANQYLLDTFNGSNGPDVVVLFTEESAGVAGSQVTWKGDHGGAAWESQHLPLIISGPGVRSHYRSTSPARLIDIAPTVLTLLGASTSGMQGIPLADAYTSSTPGMQAAQAAQARLLTPITTALEEESRSEVAAGK